MSRRTTGFLTSQGAIAEELILRVVAGIPTLTAEKEAHNKILAAWGTDVGPGTDLAGHYRVVGSLFISRSLSC